MLAACITSCDVYTDFLNFNPHLHIKASDGCFCGDDAFMPFAYPNPKHLELLFRHKVLKLLTKEGKISGAVIENMDNQHQSGFLIYCGDPISQFDKGVIEIDFQLRD